MHGCGQPPWSYRFSETGNLAEGMPLDAEWLRGNVGILAGPAYPACDSYH
jgi:hypothetical protein